MERITRRERELVQRFIDGAWLKLVNSGKPGTRGHYDLERPESWLHRSAPGEVLI